MLSIVLSRSPSLKNEGLLVSVHSIRSTQVTWKHILTKWEKIVRIQYKLVFLQIVVWNEKLLWLLKNLQNCCQVGIDILEQCTILCNYTRPLLRSCWMKMSGVMSLKRYEFHIWTCWQWPRLATQPRHCHGMIVCIIIVIVYEKSNYCHHAMVWLYVLSLS